MTNEKFSIRMSSRNEDFFKVPMINKQCKVGSYNVKMPDAMKLPIVMPRYLAAVGESAGVT